MSRRKKHLCGLCGMKLPANRADFVTGLTGFSVCKSCMAAANKVQLSRAAKEPVVVCETQSSGILTPQALIRSLDNKIIGQQEAKRAGAITLWLQQFRAAGDKHVPRSPLLLYGPTGCGVIFIDEFDKLAARGSSERMAYCRVT